MSKNQIIDAIRQRNRSADHDFLVGFNENALRTYLTRLTEVAGRRGRHTVWVRPADTAAVVTRLTAA